MTRNRLIGAFLAVLAALATAPAFAAPVTAPVVRNSAGQPIGATPVICVDTTGTYLACGGGGGGGSATPFTPSGAAVLAVTTTTARVALPSADDVTVLTNNGASDLYFNPGNSAVTATTSSYFLGAGRSMVISRGAATHIAAITASGSSSLSVTTGTGTPVISGGGGSSSVSGYAQGSPTAGELVVLNGCATLSTAPTNTTTQTNALTCGTKGGLYTTQIDAAGVPVDYTLSPIGVGATSTNGSTTVTTGGTFQSVLASNTARKFCTIQNPVAATESLFVFFGPSGATTANSFSLPAGASISCATGSGYVLTDAVFVTGATTAHAFVVNSQ